MEETLRKITEFGYHAHGNQQRKYTPDLYMVHPVRVMEQCKNYTQDITVLAAALLHDVLEDTPIGEEEMRNFLLTVMSEAQAEETLKRVIELTDVYIKDDFPQLNRRTRKAKEVERLKQISPETQTIKYADILDNSLEIIPYDPHFAKVYLHEVKTILKALDRGNPELRRKAMTVVEEGLKQLSR